MHQAWWLALAWHVCAGAIASHPHPAGPGLGAGWVAASPLASSHCWVGAEGTTAYLCWPRASAAASAVGRVHAHQPRHRWVCTPGATGARRRCLCWGVCPSARALVRAEAPAAAQQGCHPPQPAVILTDNNPAVPELGWAGAALAVAAQFSYQLCWCFPHLLHTKGLQCWSWLCRALVSLCWDPLWIPGDGAGGPWEPQPAAWDLPQGTWAGILPGL